MRLFALVGLLSALCSTSALTGQVTTASLRIGGPDAIGCQGDANPPTLTGGVAASGTVDFSYDQATLELTLVVSNTSDVVSGEATPLLTELFLNTPAGAITGMVLSSQQAGDGSTPDFRLDFGAPRAGCLGVFDYQIRGNRGGVYGIANPSGNGGPAGRTIVGPVTFVIQLSGPGAANVNARALAYGFSDAGPRQGVNGGAKFQAGGPGAQESGFLGSDTRPDDCATSMWLNGDPVVGGRVEFCRNGQRSCHDCLSISLFPGPTKVGDFDVPIGFPLLAVIDGGIFNGTERCITYDIPNDPALSGVRLYFVIATYEQQSFASLGIPTVTFGQTFTFQIR